jgi:hypothetical protein
MRKSTLKSSRFSRPQLLIFIIAFSLIGYLIFKSFAAPNPNLPGDLNNDNTVNVTDLSILLSNYSTSNSAADINNDGTVNILDLSSLLSHYGSSYVPPAPSGQAMPTGDIDSGGHIWHQIVAEDFTKDAALGSWGNSTCTNSVVYTGASGTPWKAYPSCYKDTYQKRAYRSDQVLSVQNGMLDFWLHTVDGHPAGANPSPVLPSGSDYQTYGRYEVRIKQDSMNLSEFYQAWLLWPVNDADYKCAESDFPEAPMGQANVSAFSHYGCTGSQDYFNEALDRTQWHTYTQEWMPGKRNYLIDGQLIGSATNQVWSGPQRWQLQTETNTSCESTNSCTQDGHLQVDWAVVYSY